MTFYDFINFAVCCYRTKVRSRNCVKLSMERCNAPVKLHAMQIRGKRYAYAVA